MATFSKNNSKKDNCEDDFVSTIEKVSENNTSNENCEEKFANMFKEVRIKCGFKTQENLSKAFSSWIKNKKLSRDIPKLTQSRISKIEGKEKEAIGEIFFATILNFFSSADSEIEIELQHLKNLYYKRMNKNPNKEAIEDVMANMSGMENELQFMKKFLNLSNKKKMLIETLVKEDRFISDEDADFISTMVQKIINCASVSASPRGS